MFKNIDAAMQHWARGIKAAPNLALRLLAASIAHAEQHGDTNKIAKLYFLAPSKKYRSAFERIAAGIGFSFQQEPKTKRVTLAGSLPRPGWNGNPAWDKLQELAKTDASIWGKECLAAFPDAEAEAKAEARAEAKAKAEAEAAEAQAEAIAAAKHSAIDAEGVAAWLRHQDAAARASLLDTLQAIHAEMMHAEAEAEARRMAQEAEAAETFKAEAKRQRTARKVKAA